jgi:hypothetical protein
MPPEYLRKTGKNPKKSGMPYIIGIQVEGSQAKFDGLKI